MPTKTPLPRAVLTCENRLDFTKATITNDIQCNNICIFVAVLTSVMRVMTVYTVIMFLYSADSICII